MRFTEPPGHHHSLERFLPACRRWCSRPQNPLAAAVFAGAGAPSSRAAFPCAPALSAASQKSFLIFRPYKCHLSMKNDSVFGLTVLSQYVGGNRKIHGSTEGQGRGCDSRRFGFERTSTLHLISLACKTCHWSCRGETAASSLPS